jgi:hypothetical protein
MTLELDKQISEIDELVAARFLRHRDTEIITRMPASERCSAPSSSPRPAATSPPSFRPTT